MLYPCYLKWIGNVVSYIFSVNEFVILVDDADSFSITLYFSGRESRDVLLFVIDHSHRRLELSDEEFHQSCFPNT